MTDDGKPKEPRQARTLMDTQIDPTQAAQGQVAPQHNGAANGSQDAPPAPVTVGGGKNVVLPREAFNSRLTAATERGKRAAMAEFDDQAKKHGFTSMQDMFSTVAAMRNGAASGKGGQQRHGQGKPSQRTDQDVEARGQRAPEPGNRQHDGEQNRHRSWKEQRRYEAQMDKERKAREAERRSRLHEERRRKDAERRAEALEAEMAIREQAITAGVKDVDYGVSLLRRSIEGRTADELRGFDEVKFFEELRTEKPYLFGSRDVPATTGTGGRGDQPQAPKPGHTLNGQAAAGKVDARNMNDKEFNEHMAKRGLSLSVAGV
jgi:hypothetical protein